MPPLLDENVSAIRAYSIVQNQIIVAPMGGIVGLDIRAVDVVMNHLKIPGCRRSDVFFQVLKLGNYFTNKRNEERSS